MCACLCGDGVSVAIFLTRCEGAEPWESRLECFMYALGGRVRRRVEWCVCVAHCHCEMRADGDYRGIVG